MLDYFKFFLKAGGIEFLLFFLFPVFLFFLFKIAQTLFLEKNSKFFVYLKSFGVFLLVSIGFFSFFILLCFLLSKLNATTPVERIIWASDLCASWDKHIFGVDLPFWFQVKDNSLKFIFDFLSPILIYAYNILFLVFILILFLSLMFNFSIFVRFIFSFTIIIFLSLPIWYVIPAYTPMDIFLDNRLSHTPAPNIQASLGNYQPNENLKSYFFRLRKQLDNQSSGVSTFPSMHIGWSIIILYFSFKLWRPLLFFTIPYTILNGLATVFTLQHYGVDIFSGIIVAIGAIYFSTLIRSKLKNYEMTNLFKQDLLDFYTFLKSLTNLPPRKIKITSDLKK